MQIKQGRAGAPSIRQGATFTGEVFADPVLTDAEGATMHTVFFAPRARTFWHRHDAGQILQVTGGSGWVAARDGAVSPIRAGDVVWIEPGEEHWHGAGEDSYLIHVAISLGGHDWLDEVTDEQYAGVAGGA